MLLHFYFMFSCRMSMTFLNRFLKCVNEINVCTLQECSTSADSESDHGPIYKHTTHQMNITILCQLHTHEVALLKRVYVFMLTVGANYVVPWIIYVLVLCQCNLLLLVYLKHGLTIMTLLII